LREKEELSVKLHTWIVIGMVVGVSIGYLLGPDSPVLSGEIVVLPRGQAPALYESVGGTKLPSPDRELRGTLTERSGDWAELTLLEDVVIREGRWGRLSTEDGGGQQTVFLRRELVPPQRYSSFGLAIISFFSLVGQIFLRLLKMLVVPLVIVSLSAGIASLGDPRKLGKVGAITLGYFFVTTSIAVIIGFAVALIVRPGDFMPEAERARLAGADAVTISAGEMPGLAERLLQMVPENPLRALAEGDMLQVIFFAVMLGAALCLLASDKAKPMIRLLEAATETMVRMVHMVMIVAPIGVAAMMATVTAKSGLAVMYSLFWYGLVVIIGLALHVLLCYLPAVRFLAGVKIRRFLRAARPTQLLTFGTSSSSAALPVTMECAEKGLGISKHTSSFVIPVGSTVNMDGTALYQGVATVFIAQLFGLDLGIHELVQVVAMATLASVGAAGVPGAGMVTLTMVLTSLGLPVEGIAIIMGVDRILDMFRSAVNVTGDLSCAAVVSRFQGERPGSEPFREIAPPKEDQSTEHPDEGGRERG
jgi:Na+/H+-dicarboxylate symporter